MWIYECMTCIMLCKCAGYFMKSSILKISIVLTVLLCTAVGFAELIAGYSFDVNAADDSGNGHHGALAIGSAIITDAERGNVLNVAGGDGVSLTGTNNGDNWLTNALMQSHTVMMWTKFTSWGDVAWLPTLFWKGNDYQLSERNLTNTLRWTAREASFYAPQAIYSDPLNPPIKLPT